MFMRVLTHIGEACAEVDGKSYLVRPSFRALSRIDELDAHVEGVCRAYNALLAGFTPTVTDTCFCANVLEECSDLPVEWLGGCKETRTGWKYKFDRLNMRELVIMGHHCIKWGVKGDPKEKPTKAAKEQLAKQPPRAFDPHEFVAVMIDEFHLSSDDAWNSTMTEFQRLCEHRQRKNWGDRPEPISDEEREDLRKSYRSFLERKKQSPDAVKVTSGKPVNFGSR